MSLSLILMAVAFFILTLGTLFLSMATLAYVYRVHKWHQSCRRFEAAQDANIESLVAAQAEVATSIRGIAQRHEHMTLLLVDLTNEVLTLTQERIKRISVPPKQG